MNSPSLGFVLGHLRGLADPHAAGAACDGQLLEQFTACREEAAFAALLRRHGPMVLAVCRRVLHNSHDAEDAFQATFLLLARKAGSIRRGEALGAWLHRVALNLALKIRAQAARRREHERRATSARPASVNLQEAWHELQTILDEELDRLPAKYRAPLVLCYLEGKTQEEATRQLGLPLGTVRSRLARARQRLRARLTRRGLGLSAGTLATALLAQSAGAALPVALFRSALQGSLLFAARLPLPGLVSERVADLAREGIPMSAGALGKTALALLLAACLGAAGVMLGTPPAPARGGAGGGKNQAGKAARPEPPVPKPEGKRMVIAGRVLAPDGKPVRGARVAAVADVLGADAEEVLGLGTTDPAGRFKLEVRRTTSSRDYDVRVIAAARGYGFGWRTLHPDTEQPRADIHLFPEQVLRGRLVDLQGQPAAGVKVYLAYVGYKKAREDRAVGLRKPRGANFPWAGPVTTDARGRFTLPGLGRGLLVGLRIDDERFARQELHNLDPAGEGPEITRPLLPPQVVEGRVTFADTGKPVPGATLRAVGQIRKMNQPTFEHGTVIGQTDVRGRFRIRSYPGNTIHLTVHPPAGTPYLSMAKDVDWPAQAVRQRVDLALPRGILVSGRVAESPSGKPAADVHLEYWQQKADNPFYREDVAAAGLDQGVKTGRDGKFRVAVLPGPGVLLFRGGDPVYIQQPVYRDPVSEKLSTRPPAGRRLPVPPWFLDAIKKINFRPGAEPPVLEVMVRRGRTVPGRLLGADGKPVARALGCGGVGAVVLADGRFTLTGCDPDRTYPVFFLDAGNKQGAAAHIPGKAGAGPVTVRLAPCGSAVMRLVDSQGRPLPNYRPNSFAFQLLVPASYPTRAKKQQTGLTPAETIFLESADSLHYPESLRADDRGRLTLPVLIPGGTYRIYTRTGPKDFTAPAGKTVNLGDLQLGP